LGAVAVGLLADVVAGPVDEGVAMAGALDHVAARAIDLEAAEGPSGGEGLFDQGDRCVAGLGDDLEDGGVLLGDGLADEADAGQVAVDAAGPVHLGPEVDQDEVALADLGVAAGHGLVVRVAAVGADADDGGRGRSSSHSCGSGP